MGIARQVVSLALFVAVTAPAWAVNVVTNPSFAGNLAGWNAAGTTVFDAVNDATGLPGSGSARSSFAAGGASTLLALDQCIAAGPGNYTLGGKVFIPAGQPVGGSGIILVSYFSGGSCVAVLLGSDTLSTSTVGSFQTLSGPIVAPAGTTNIWITGQNMAAGAGLHIVNFDDFVLDNGLAPAQVPTLGGLEMILLAALAAAAGAATLRRRL